MPNFIDYTKYYGEKSFEEVPFNDIDALILAELSYLNFSDVSDELPNTIENISKSYFYVVTKEKLKVRKMFISMPIIYLDMLKHLQDLKILK